MFCIWIKIKLFEIFHILYGYAVPLLLHSTRRPEKNKRIFNVCVVFITTRTFNEFQGEWGKCIQQFKLNATYIVGFGWCPCCMQECFQDIPNLMWVIDSWSHTNCIQLLTQFLEYVFMMIFPEIFKFSNGWSFKIHSVSSSRIFWIYFEVSLNQIRGYPSPRPFPSLSELNYKLISRLKNCAPEEISKCWFSSLI